MHLCDWMSVCILINLYWSLNVLSWWRRLARIVILALTPASSHTTVQESMRSLVDPTKRSAFPLMACGGEGEIVRMACWDCLNV